MCKRDTVSRSCKFGDGSLNTIQQLERILQNKSSKLASLLIAVLLMFDVVFEIPSGVEIGEHQFLISVREAGSDDAVGTGITFNVE